MRLDISHNRLYSVSQEMFEGLGNLRSLDLSNNFNIIRSQPFMLIERPFRQLRNLQSLAIRGGYLDVLNSTQFSGLNSLMSLDLNTQLDITGRRGSSRVSNRILFVTGPFEDSPLLRNLSMAGNPSVCTINSTGGMQCQCGQHDTDMHKNKIPVTTAGGEQGRCVCPRDHFFAPVKIDSGTSMCEPCMSMCEPCADGMSLHSIGMAASCVPWNASQEQTCNSTLHFKEGPDDNIFHIMFIVVFCLWLALHLMAVMLKWRGNEFPLMAIITRVYHNAACIVVAMLWSDVMVQICTRIHSEVNINNDGPCPHTYWFGQTACTFKGQSEETFWAVNLSSFACSVAVVVVLLMLLAKRVKHFWVEVTSCIQQA